MEWSRTKTNGEEREAKCCEGMSLFHIKKVRLNHTINIFSNLRIKSTKISFIFVHKKLIILFCAIYHHVYFVLLIDRAVGGGRACSAYFLNINIQFRGKYFFIPVADFFTPLDHGPQK